MAGMDHAHLAAAKIRLFIAADNHPDTGTVHKIRIGKIKDNIPRPTSAQLFIAELPDFSCPVVVKLRSDGQNQIFPDHLIFCFHIPNPPYF